LRVEKFALTVEWFALLLEDKRRVIAVRRVACRNKASMARCVTSHLLALYVVHNLT
jgi:hypothetical protein